MIYKQKILVLILFFICGTCTIAQKHQKLFEDSYILLDNMITNQKNYSFRKAVFSVENAYLDGNLDTVFINKSLKNLHDLSLALTKERFLSYPEKDKDKVNKWAAVFQVICDTIPLNINDTIYQYIPFGYDFNDVFGHEYRENLFVSKLLETRKGNCRSLPYLYKILAEELGVDANLALAPNHVYIKHQSLKDGWYNTELTSGIFPVDAWIMASGFVHIDAIANGVYMKALNNNESIALILIDLADNYKAIFPDNDGSFILKCCETALKQYPNFATALILKAETQYNCIEKEKDKMKQIKLFKNLEKEYAYIHKTGYRNMPENMYIDWLMSLKKEKSKYENKNLNKK
ncbi:hypothetical protein BXU01_05150 [[Flexibacter] sp. ATCC 35103]|nr:hypothetical protein BXU01_05150 [[Flexibacter] sp. ATCC 35103]